MTAPTDRLRLWRLLGCGVLLALVTGCGVSAGNNTGTTSTSAPTATSATSTTLVASSGCPSSQKDVTWPTPPAAVVTSQTQGTTTIKVGQSLEIALAYGSRWALASGDTGGPFTLDSPAGYPDDQLNACLWHFTAKTAGSQEVTFTRSALCAPHVECPQDIAVIDVSIAATA